jgi:hypothetical protein
LFNPPIQHQDHIYVTKDKTVKTSCIDDSEIDYSKEVQPQLRDLLGKGNRITTGKVCNKLLTDDDNIALLEALDKEKGDKEEFKAAKDRLAKSIGYPPPSLPPLPLPLPLPLPPHYLH